MHRIHHPLRVLFLFAVAVSLGWWLTRRAEPVPAVSSLGQGSKATDVAAVSVALAPNPVARETANSLPVADSGILTNLTYAQAWNTDLPPAFAAFREWTKKYVATGAATARAALEEEGLALVRARRVAMQQLMASDPRAALASTIPVAVRSQLPPGVAAELETRFSVVGDFSLFVFDYGPKELIRRKQMGLSTEVFQPHVQWPGGTEYRAYVYGRREGQTAKNSIPLHGILLDGIVALHESAVRLLEPGEISPATQAPTTVASAAGSAATPTPILAEIGGKLYRFASADEVLRIDRKFTAAEAGIGPNLIPSIDSVILGVAPTLKSSGTLNPPDQPLPATAWTIGNKKILVIRVDFSDLIGEPKRGSTTYTAAYVENLANTQVAPYYAQSSFGAASLTTTATTQVYRMPQTAATYAVAGNNSQLHTDARAAATANYTLASYDRIVVLFSFLGVSVIPGSQITYGGLANVGGANVWVNGEWDFRVAAHELGHTWGLLHANLWQVTDGNPVSAVGVSTEYGDDFDTMGANFANDQRTDFNPWFKNRLGWVADSQVQTITSTGTYRVNRFDNSSGTGTLALKVVRDATRSYWIGARRAFTANATMQHGAYVVWGYNSNHTSDLLDLTTPGTGVSDAALAIGATLNDTVGNVSIKLVSEGGTAPNEYIDVLVNMGLNGLPVVSTSPASRGFSVGDTVAFTVAVTGTAPFSYQWRKDGVDIPGASAATHTITNTQTAHIGSYTVRITNAVGTIVSAAAVLSLNSPPVIAAPPVNIATTAGLSPVFTVGVTGFPVATYQWRKAGAAISGATSAIYAITNVQAAHAGTYDVVATNSFGAATSVSVSLAVNAAASPPSNDAFLSPWVLSGDAGLALGSNVGATGEGSEPAHVSAGGTASSVWYRWTPAVSGTAQIDTIGSIFDTVLAVYTGSTLTTLTKLRQDDDSGDAAGGGPSLVSLPVTAGTVYSIAVGGYNATDRGTISLNYKVAAAPVVATQPVSTTGGFGGTASFSVAVTGAGPLSYQWYRNGVALAGAISPTLALANLTSADAGSYYCVITNAAGTVTSGTAALLGAIAAPTITTPPVGQALNAGATLTLSVVATGTPAPIYEWRRNGTAISGATAATFTRANAQLADAGSYTVVVSNSSGIVTSTPVTVTVVPAGAVARHVVVRSGYTAGGTVTLSNTLNYSGAATSVSWLALLPTGWSFASSSGDTGATKPTAGAVEFAEWIWTTPPNPVAFTCTLNVPTGATGTFSLVSRVTLVQDGATIPLLAQTDPLVIAAAATRHTADSDGDGKISLFELTRVIELYNGRNGPSRTGAYKVDGLSEDGFASDPLRIGTPVLSRYHSADVSQDGKIALLELTRVIELYNTRSGPTRTGVYHVQAGTEDGFGAGP